MKHSQLVIKGEYEDMRFLYSFMHIFFFPDVEPLAVSRAYYTDSGFPLFWQSDANATCGYVVEWHDASCTWDCAVEWIKVAAGNTNVSIESGMPALMLPLKRHQPSL